MDIISLYYFSELAKELHMTRTAERLYISQQTLSNHILRLEQQFDCRLFYRKPSLSLTYAGEQVLQFAQIVLKEQTNLNDILADIKKEEQGCIRFGASTLRMNACIPAILPEFARIYPHVEIRLEDGLGEHLIQMVLSGDLDFALTGSTHEERNDLPSLLTHHLMYDQVFLCVTDGLLSQYYPEEVPSLKAASANGAHVEDFARLPFCLFSNALGRAIQQCFEDVGIVPQIYMSSHHLQITTNVGLHGVAAFFSTRMALSSRIDEIPPDMNIFPLLFREKPVQMHVNLIYSRQRYLPEYAKEFMRLLDQYFSELRQTQLEKTV